MDQSQLKKRLWYDKDTGVFLWRISSSPRIRPWSKAGKVTPTGYVRIGLDGKSYAAHRLAWLYVHGCHPENYIDHIDGNPRNNKFENLREATNKQNQENQKQHSSNSTGYRGVTFHKGVNKYQAQVGHHGKLIYLGLFETLEQAANAVREKREILYTHENGRAL